MTDTVTPATDVSPPETLPPGDALPPSDNQKKLLIVGAMALVMLVLGGGYFVWAQGRVNTDIVDRNQRAQAVVDQFEASQDAIPAPTNVPSVPAPLVAGVTTQPGEVLVVNRVPGDDYGRMAIRHTDGSRTLLNRRCVRVHLANDHGVCLSNDGGVVPRFDTTFFEAANMDIDIKSYPSALPSRARLTPDGSLSAVTAFVSGASYADIGAETTTIVTIDDIDSNQLLRGASGFTVDSDEARFDNQNAQYWGMTFADNDEFYITGFYGTAPEIMHGSLDAMQVEPTGWVGSCPSLSPDGKTLVFKEMRPDGGFDLVAVDLATDEKWQLGESRSADDQVEWLDNDTILYALHPDGGDTPAQPEFDIWALDIAPGSEPVLFLPNADSPAVTRSLVAG